MQPKTILTVILAELMVKSPVGVQLKWVDEINGVPSPRKKKVRN